MQIAASQNVYPSSQKTVLYGTTYKSASNYMDIGTGMYIY